MFFNIEIAQASVSYLLPITYFPKLMRSKIHYYLRFLFGLTQSEIKGIACLIMLLVLWLGFAQYQSYQLEHTATLRFQPAFYESKLDSLLMKKRNYQRHFDRKFNNHTYSNYKKSTFAYFTKVKKSGKQEPMILDINSADSLQWISLPGIGPAFAKRILAYREKLGGFYSLEQLKEVYGLDSTWVNHQTKYLRIGQGVYRKISLQKTEWKDFRHPYLPYAQAKIFLSYRKHHPEIQSFQELDNIQLLDKNVWNKLRPYLD